MSTVKIPVNLPAHWEVEVPSNYSKDEAIEIASEIFEKSKDHGKIVTFDDEYLSIPTKAIEESLYVDDIHRDYIFEKNDKKENIPNLKKIYNFLTEGNNEQVKNFICNLF